MLSSRFFKVFNSPDNPSITLYGVELAATLPNLRVLVTKPSDERYMLYPQHYLSDWGHDAVIHWLTEDPPKKTGKIERSMRRI